MTNADKIAATPTLKDFDEGLSGLDILESITADFVPDLEAYAAACRLLDALWPGLQKMPTTVGVITQIDNATIALRRAVRAQALEDASERARRFSCCGEDIATAILEPFDVYAQRTTP